MSTGGSIEEVSIGGRAFSVPGDNEAQLKIGGFTNETQMNGNGTGRLIKTRVANGVDGLLVDIDHAAGDLIFLQDTANSKKFWDITVTLADGAVYQGKSQISGDFSGSTQSATAAITLSGPGTYTLQ